MHRICWILAALSVAALLGRGMSDASAQRRMSGLRRSSSSQRMEQLIRRIDHLEQRVSNLEGLVNVPVPDAAPVPPRVDLEQVERRLAVAKERLRASESLFRKGYASEAEVEANRFDVKRAHLLLAIGQAAEAGQSTEGLAAEIQVVAAEQDLAVATRRLDLTQRLAAKGFALPTDVDAHRQAVSDAQERLQQLKSAAVPRSQPER